MTSQSVDLTAVWLGSLASLEVVNADWLFDAVTSVRVGVDWLVAGWEEVEEVGVVAEVVPELQSSAAAAMVLTLMWDDFEWRVREGQA